MANKPLNWKDLFLDFHSAFGIHSLEDLQAIKSLTDGSIEEEDETTWIRLTRETDLLYLFTCANGEMQILHHLELIGNRHSKEFKAVGLCGFSSQAPPVEIDLNRDFHICSTRIPKWEDFINALEGGVEEIQRLKAETEGEENTRIANLIANGMSQEEAKSQKSRLFRSFSIIAIPTGLSRILLETSDRNPASLAYKFWNLMIQLDEEHEGETEGYASYRTHFRHLIKFLWMASRKLMHKVPYVLSDNQKVQEWANRVHQAYLDAKISPVSTSNAISPDQDATALERIAYSITSTLENRLTHKTATKEDENGEGQGFKKKFGPHLQQLFLNASATLPYETAAEEPPSTFDKFLSQKTLGSAKTFLRGCLRANPFLDFTPSAGLTTCMYTGNVQWDDTYTPRNFSIFFCGKHQSNNGPSSSYTDQALYLKEQLGNGINESEVKQILKQDKSCPKDAAELLDQIQNFLAICSFIFGENSKIAMALKTWVHHLNRNKASYDSMQRADCTFLSQILYCIDMAIQVHLTSCLTETNRSDVNDDCLDFSNDQQSVTRRQFFITLPQSIKNLALTVNPQDKTPGNEAGKQGGGGLAKGNVNGLELNQARLKDENYRKRLIEELENFNTPKIESKKVKNQNPVKDWLLQPDEPFGQVFQTKIKTCPKQDRTFVCLKFWIKGECFKNCKFIHADLKQETKAGITEWINQCRSDFGARGS